MKVITITTRLLLISFSSLAFGINDNELVTEATLSSEGTVVIEGKPYYQKSFNVSIFNMSKNVIQLSGDTGCYKAFDESGHEYEHRSVSLTLLGDLKDTPKYGSVSYISHDDSIYKAKFIKWSSNCANVNNE